METKIIYRQMSKVMAAIDPIRKDKTASIAGGATYKFRGIDDIYAACNQSLVDNGVFTTNTILEQSRTERISKSGATLLYTILTVRFTFWAEDGSSVDTMAIGEAMDSGDKSSNKAMSTAYKYAFLQTFCIPTDDLKDSDSANFEVMPIQDIKLQVVPEKPPVSEETAKNVLADASEIKHLDKFWKELTLAEREKYRTLFTKRREEIEAELMSEEDMLELISQAETQEELGKLWGELSASDKTKYKPIFTKKRLELEGGTND
jgi:hypothetical protein